MKELDYKANAKTTKMDDDLKVIINISINIPFRNLPTSTNKRFTEKLTRFLMNNKLCKMGYLSLFINSAPCHHRRSTFDRSEVGFLYDHSDSMITIHLNWTEANRVKHKIIIG